MCCMMHYTGRQAWRSPAGSSEEMTPPHPCQHGLSVVGGLNAVGQCCGWLSVPDEILQCKLMQLRQVLARVAK